MPITVEKVVCNTTDETPRLDTKPDTQDRSHVGHQRACGMPKVLSNGRVPEPPAAWSPSEGDALEFHPALPKPAAVKVLATGSAPCSIPICVSQPEALGPIQQSRVLASGRWPTIPPGLFWDDDPFLELETGLEEDG